MTEVSTEPFSVSTAQGRAGSDEVSNYKTQTPLKILIVGGGLGGLSCAIACLREGMKVEILEKAQEFTTAGGGIHSPPNATRILVHYGLIGKFLKAAAIMVNQHTLLKYSDGEIIIHRPETLPWMIEQYGHRLYVAHRADYHRMLLEEALRLGANVRLNCDVQSVNVEDSSIFLNTGEKITGDVVIGADGLRSRMRNQLFGSHLQPVETGDLAYRALLSRSDIEGLNDPSMEPLLNETTSFTWLGPHRHAVFYPIRNHTQFNFVLLRPDDLPPTTYRSVADIQEMRDTFKGWDPRLTALISRIDSVEKWKLCHMYALDSWVMGRVALLGDACHPTTPYQGQGGAMAVEDGAVIGTLLGLLSKHQHLTPSARRANIPAMLQLYEAMRKERTTINVKGAINYQHCFHLEDGPSSEARNEELRQVDWNNPDAKCKWFFGDLQYQKDMLGFDPIADAIARFHAWADRVSSS